MDENNCWVKMSQCIPRNALAEGYYQGLNRRRSTRHFPAVPENASHTLQATAGVPGYPAGIEKMEHADPELESSLESFYD